MGEKQRSRVDWGPVVIARGGRAPGCGKSSNTAATSPGVSRGATRGWLGHLCRALSAAAVAAGLALSQAAAAPPQVLTIAYPAEANAFHDAAAEIVRQAYRKLGIEVVYSILPAERALLSSNTGAVDGELVRVAGIEKIYPNLIRIPVSTVTAEQMAFGRDAGVVIDGWQSLAPYRLGFHRGYKVAELNTEGMSRELTGDDAAALRMVAGGRVDIAVANRFTGVQAIKDLGLDNVHMLMPPVQVDPLYHYLHRKHAALVPKITAVLSRMEAEGEIAAIRQRFGIALVGE